MKEILLVGLNFISVCGLIYGLMKVKQTKDCLDKLSNENKRLELEIRKVKKENLDLKDTLKEVATELTVSKYHASYQYGRYKALSEKCGEEI